MLWSVIRGGAGAGTDVVDWAGLLAADNRDWGCGYPPMLDGAEVSPMASAPAGEETRGVEGTEVQADAVPEEEECVGEARLVVAELKLACLDSGRDNLVGAAGM